VTATSFGEAGLAALLPDGVVGQLVICSAGQSEALAPLFPEEVDERLLRSVEKRQREFRAGRDAARRALGLLGIDACAIPKDPAGPPCFPSNITGSITHAGRDVTLAAAVATRAALLLGIDAEEARVLDPDVAARVASADDLAALELLGLGPLTPLVAFSAKEAVYKALYPRFRTFLEFHDVALRTPDGTLRAHVARLDQTIDVRHYIGEEWVITLAHG